jgi:peptidoglycan/LPS O-acetylase OafA/YrhL
LVAPYTAVTAGLVGLVAKVTSSNPHPDQHTAWRWAAFAILIVGIIGLTWEGKRRKSGGGPFPLLEITGALIAGTGWAFALPGSPLTPYLHGTTAQTAMPLLIAFGAIVASALTANALQSPRNSAPPPAEQGEGAKQA